MVRNNQMYEIKVRSNQTFVKINRSISQIPQSTSPASPNASHCNKNGHTYACGNRQYHEKSFWKELFSACFTQIMISRSMGAKILSGPIRVRFADAYIHLYACESLNSQFTLIAWHYLTILLSIYQIGASYNRTVSIWNAYFHNRCVRLWCIKYIAWYLGEESVTINGTKLIFIPKLTSFFYFIMQSLIYDGWPHTTSESVFKKFEK